jgi:two-component system nitrate/nitrite response regulator NarL
MISVAILSDVQLLRDSLACALARYERFQLVPSSRAFDDALAEIAAERPRVALIDVGNVAGLQALRRIHDLACEVKCIAVGVDDDPGCIIACAEAGASGYLTREASLAELVETIDALIDGRLCCSQRIALSLFTHVGRLAAGHGPEAHDLTQREAEVLDLIALGQGNKQIARQLGIKISTVKNHVHAILGKLGAASRCEAAAISRARAGVGSRHDPGRGEAVGARKPVPNGVKAYDRLMDLDH